MQMQPQVKRVGIITMPPNNVAGAASYIPLSVINWFRDAGIQVVPISYRLRPRDVPATLQHVNGLFLQRGPNYQPRYMRLVSHFLKAAQKANAAGDHFPILGTCHGLQMILKEFGAPWPLKPVDSMNWTAPLKVTETGRMIIPNTASADFSHQYGITKEQFDSVDSLRNSFRILATAVDRRGQEYIAAIEHKTQPIYGLQFHPELTSESGSGWSPAFFKAELEKSTHQGALPKGAAIRSATRTRCSSEWAPYHSDLRPPTCLRFRRTLKGIRPRSRSQSTKKRRRGSKD
jgi:GMP synthase-like glutamine amidotransferase